MDTVDILTKLEQYGVGRRKLDDDLFVNDQPPSRLGIFDEDEDQCLPVTPTQCSVPGCQFTADSTLHYEKHYNSSHRYSCSQCRRVSPSPHLLDLHIQEQHDSFFAVMAARKPSYSHTMPGCQFTADSTLHYEKHYNSSHRYSCSQCRRVSPSPHLLDLHIQEQHDSFFAVMAARKPSYSCYIEECKDKFINAEERLNHCVKIHKLPKDFRFDHKPKRKSKNEKSHQSMVTDGKAEENRTEKKNKEQKFNFANNKQKGFIYNGKMFTKEQESSSSVDMDAIMTDLKENLPQS